MPMKLRALASLFIGALAIAMSGILFRFTDVSPIASGFWRVALAVPIFGAWMIFDTARIAGHGDAVPRSWWREPGILWCGVFFAGDLIFWHYALAHNSVAVATLESNMTPLLVVAAMWMFYGQRPTAAFLAAIAISVAGLLAITSPKLVQHSGELRGDVYGLITAVFYAGYLFTVARVRARFRTSQVMFATTLVAALVLLPLSLFGTFLPTSTQGWVAVVALALVAQCLGQGLIAYALAHLPTAFGSVGLYVQPVAAALYAWVLLGEKLSAVQLAGAALVLLGIALARRASSQSTERR